MSIRQLAWSFLWLVAIALGACRSPPPDEQRLRETLDTLQQAGVERRFDDLLDHVADDFAGPSHTSTRKDLERLLRLLALRVRDVTVTRLGTEIQLHEGQRATAKLTVLIAGDAGGLLNETREVVIDSAWKVDGGEWVMIRAEWN
jgi:hypothetical protein